MSPSLTRIHMPIKCLEKEMATHASTLVWRIPWMEKPGRLQSMGSLRVRRDWATSLSLFISEGNDNPLQCSCLENPRDRGPWWAAVCGVVQSQTQPKHLSSSSIKCHKQFQGVHRSWGSFKHSLIAHESQLNRLGLNPSST